MTEHKDRIEHTLEMLVYAPIGVGLFLKDMGPRSSTCSSRAAAPRSTGATRRCSSARPPRRASARSRSRSASPMVRQRVEREVGNARQRGAVVPRRRSSGRDATAAPARRAREPAPAPRRRPRAGCRSPLGRTARADGRRQRRTPTRSLPDPRLRRAVGVAGRRAARRARRRRARRGARVRGSAPQAPHDPRQDRPALRVADRGGRARRRPPPTSPRVAELAHALRAELARAAGRTALGDARGARPSRSTIALAALLGRDDAAVRRRHDRRRDRRLRDRSRSRRCATAPASA